MGNYFAYMRISTKEEREKQKFTRQEKALEKWAKENGVEFIHEEREDASGKSFDNRPKWQRIEKLLQKDDTVVFKDLSRFTREAENGFNKYSQLMEKGVNIIFIDNPTISTDYIKELLNIAKNQDNNIANDILKFFVEMLLKVELYRAEEERKTISKRTKDGLAASDKKSGREVGHLDKMNDKLKADLKKYIELAGTPDAIKIADIMKKHKISRNTVCKYRTIVYEEMKREKQSEQQP